MCGGELEPQPLGYSPKGALAILYAFSIRWSRRLWLSRNYFPVSRVRAYKTGTKPMFIAVFY